MKFVKFQHHGASITFAGSVFIQAQCSTLTCIKNST